MTPLFTQRTKCAHPAIMAARQCRTAMELANDGQPTKALAILKTAMHGLRRTGQPMMKAKILNSLGLVHALQGKHHQAGRCLSASLRATHHLRTHRGGQLALCSHRGQQGPAEDLSRPSSLCPGRQKISAARDSLCPLQTVRAS